MTLEQLAQALMDEQGYLISGDDSPEPAKVGMVLDTEGWGIIENSKVSGVVQAVVIGYATEEEYHKQWLRSFDLTQTPRKSWMEPNFSIHYLKLLAE